MAAFLGERECVLNQLALTVVVKDLIGVDEFCVLLQEVYSWQDLLVKPILDLIVPREVRFHELRELLLKLLLRSALRKAEVLIIGVDTVVFCNDILIVVNHC